MKKLPLLLLLAALLVCSIVYARGPATVFNSGGVMFPGQSTAASGSSYLVEQDFETDVEPDTTPPAGWTVYKDSGVVNFNTTGVTPQLVGNFSFAASSVNAGYTGAYVTLASDYTNTTLYVYFRMKFTELKNDLTSTQFLARTSGGANICSATFPTGTKSWSLYHGTKSDALPLSDLVQGTEYHVWIDIKDNSGGGNGIIRLRSSTDGVKPADPAPYLIENGDDADTGIRQLAFLTGDWNTVLFDTIRVSTSVLGDNGALP